MDDPIIMIRVRHDFYLIFLDGYKMRKQRFQTACVLVLSLFALVPAQARGDGPGVVAPPNPSPALIANPVAAMSSLASERAGTLSAEDQALLQDILSSIPEKISDLTSVLGTASHGFSGPECLTADQVSDAVAILKPLIATSVQIFKGTEAVPLEPSQSEAMKHLAALVAVDGLKSSYWTLAAPLADGFLTPSQPHAPVFLSLSSLLHTASGAHSCLTNDALAAIMVEASLIHLDGSLPVSWKTPEARAQIAAGYLASLTGY